MREHPEGCVVRTDGREGRVVAVDGERATVLVEADAACGQGASCAHCSVFQPGSHTVQVRRGDLKEGDRVRLVVSPRSAYRSIILVFLAPMAFAILGFFAGVRILTVMGDLGGILGCMAGFVLAIVIALGVNRRMAGTSDLVVERLDGPTTEE